MSRVKPISTMNQEERDLTLHRANEHRVALMAGTVPPEYFTRTELGLNPNLLRGVFGYELAVLLREAADRLEGLARWMETCEDAYAAVEECDDEMRRQFDRTSWKDEGRA